MNSITVSPVSKSAWLLLWRLWRLEFESTLHWHTSHKVSWNWPIYQKWLQNTESMLDHIMLLFLFLFLNQAQRGQSGTNINRNRKLQLAFTYHFPTFKPIGWLGFNAQTEPNTYQPIHELLILKYNFIQNTALLTCTCNVVVVIKIQFIVERNESNGQWANFHFTS